MKTKNNSELEVMKYRISLLEKKVQELEAMLVIRPDPYPHYHNDPVPWFIGPVTCSAKESA